MFLFCSYQRTIIYLFYAVKKSTAAAENSGRNIGNPPSKTIYFCRKRQAPGRSVGPAGWSSSETNLPVGTNLCGGVTSAILDVFERPQSPGW